MTYPRESHGDSPSSTTVPAPARGFDAVPKVELQTCLRDMMGLLALPSLWSGRDPATVLRILAEALEGILAIEVCHATAIFNVNEPPISLLRVERQAIASSSTAWSEFGQTCVSALSHEPTITLEQTPLGELRVARLAMSYSGHVAVLAIGASRSDFPRLAETVLLRAAASLAASGLRTARLMQEREEALRAKDEFLAMLGHELRNPLAPIVTALDLMKLRAGGELTREQQIIERQVGSLTALVDDLLDVARVTRGKIELKKTPVDIARIVSKAVETARPLLERHGHHLQVDIAWPVPIVDADPMRLSQVVANLLVNAAKYTPPGGDIMVKATRNVNQMQLSVKDNGIGMDEKLLPHVFELFEQGHVTMDRAAGGLGIGLAIVKSLVGLHGGAVSAHSEGPGRGSEFVVALPLSAAGNTPMAPGHREASRVRSEGKPRERVLVVDDNRDAAEMAAEFLRTVGHEAAVAYDAPEALALSESFHPTVMVLDIGLPVIDGYELAVMIRERWGNSAPRMIALTGYGLAHDRNRSREAGVAVHLVKPVRLQSLLDAVVDEPVPPSE
jgi:signal transduction histidine kinase/ActR/RegA family two-component response regulator